MPEAMAPADVYVGFLDSNFTPHVVDSTTEPPFKRELPDAQQDVAVLGGGYANGVLSFTFARLLDTRVCAFRHSCARASPPLLRGVPVFVTWANHAASHWVGALPPPSPPAG